MFRYVVKRMIKWKIKGYPFPISNLCSCESSITGKDLNRSYFRGTITDIKFRDLPMMVNHLSVFLILLTDV